MKRRVATWAVVIALVVPAATAFADTLFVRSKTGEVKSEPRGAADTTTTLNFGDSVDAGQAQGQWVPVTVNGAPGWVYGASLDHSKPADDPSLKAQDGTPLKGDDVDAGSAVRGVGESATKYANKNAIMPEHRKYIDYHQSFVVSDRKITELPPNRDLVTKKDIEAFMKEGGLGPYSNGK
jgi:hypothetical protein